MSKVFDLNATCKHTKEMQLMDGSMLLIAKHIKYFLTLSILYGIFSTTPALAAAVTVPDCQNLTTTQLCNANNYGSCAMQCRASLPAYQGIRTSTYNYYALSCPQGYKLASQRYYSRSSTATTIKPVSAADEYARFRQNYTCQVNPLFNCYAVSGPYSAGNSQTVNTTYNGTLLMDLPSNSTSSTVCTAYQTVCASYGWQYNPGTIVSYTTWGCCPGGTGCFGPHRSWYTPLGQACDGAGYWASRESDCNWAHPSHCQYVTSPQYSNSSSVPNYNPAPSWTIVCNSYVQQCVATTTTYAVCGRVHECVEPVTPNHAYTSPPLEGSCIYTGVQWKGSSQITPPQTCASGSVCPPTVTPKSLDSDSAAPEWQ